MWTPDGDTLGDSPITISGINATFAGTVQATSYKIGGVTVLQGTSTVTVGSGGGTGKVQLNTTSGVGLILDGSNVGIGTTSPSTKLHGDSSTAFSLTSVAGDTLFLSDDTNPSALNGVGASIGFSGPQEVQRQAAIAALRTGSGNFSYWFSFLHSSRYKQR